MLVASPSARDVRGSDLRRSPRRRVIFTLAGSQIEIAAADSCSIMDNPALVPFKERGEGGTRHPPLPAEDSGRGRYRRPVKRVKQSWRRKTESEGERRITLSRQREPSPESKMFHTSRPVLEKRESIIYPGGLLGGREGGGEVTADDSLCVRHTFNKNLFALFLPPSSVRLHLLTSVTTRRFQR